MPENWKEGLFERMREERVTMTELGKEVGVSKCYVSMVLNGKRKGVAIRERMEAAMAAILERRAEATA